MIKKIGIGILVLLVAIQFVRPAKNNGAAEGEQDIAHFVAVSPEIKTILKTSCYDCHSNHTNYEWYHEIMPFGWVAAHHVDEGKHHLNFSDFSGFSAKKIDHKLEETVEEVQEHEMPLGLYTALHKEATLSEEQIKMLVDWANAERSKLDLK